MRGPSSLAVPLAAVGLLVGLMLVGGSRSVRARQRAVARSCPGMRRTSSMALYLNFFFRADAVRVPRILLPLHDAGPPKRSPSSSYSLQRRGCTSHGRDRYGQDSCSSASWISTAHRGRYSRLAAPLHGHLEYSSRISSARAGRFGCPASVALQTSGGAPPRRPEHLLCLDEAQTLPQTRSRSVCCRLRATREDLQIVLFVRRAARPPRIPELRPLSSGSDHLLDPTMTPPHSHYIRTRFGWRGRGPRVFTERARADHGVRGGIPLLSTRRDHCLLVGYSDETRRSRDSEPRSYLQRGYGRDADPGRGEADSVRVAQPGQPAALGIVGMTPPS